VDHALDGITKFDVVQLTVLGLVAVAQIVQIVRSEQALKREIAAKDAALSAKDDALKARDAQIEALRELTSVKVREHYQATKVQLEEYIDELKSKIQQLESRESGQGKSLDSGEHAKLYLELRDSLDATLDKIHARLEDELKLTKKRLGQRGVIGDQHTLEALELLSRGPKGQLEVVYQRDDPEAFHFAQDLYLLLTSTGWEATRPTPIPNSSDDRPSAVVAGASNTDLTIAARVLEDCRGRTDTAYCALVAGLQRCGLGLHMTQRDDLSPGVFRIIIGPRW
jgi:hypothetical protein